MAFWFLSTFPVILALSALPVYLRSTCALLALTLRLPCAYLREHFTTKTSSQQDGGSSTKVRKEKELGTLIRAD